MPQTLIADEPPVPKTNESPKTNEEQQTNEERLDRFPPLDSVQALDSFEVADGFRIELVACEPLVVDPIAFCFDAAGRMIVVEMRGYSERPDDQMGRVRRLTDTDNDGVMDCAETLAEGLSWPTAVEIYKEGILVATAPDLLFISTNEQPNDAEVVPEVWCTGFGKSNVQGLVNSLRWGLDLRLHGATSSSGAEITGLGNENPLRLGRRDFAIEPSRRMLVATAGGGQHGMMIDPWGDKYVCSNSDHLQQVIAAEPRQHRTTKVYSEPSRRRSIALDGPQAEVYRSSPVEPWRILRTRLRVSGLVPGPIEGGGRAAGYFTGATGVWVYDGDQWPHPEQPIALVCDVGSNLIHRKQLNDDGLWKSGTRIDSETEFIRSTDTWFRPVQLGTGPDGALYIADMYREVIEHPKSLPPVIKSQVDLNSGNDRGRIWRVVSSQRNVARKPVNLGDLDSTDLVKAIDSRNAWQRRTAARLIVERGWKRCAGDLARLVTDGHFPEGRLQALATLGALRTSLDPVHFPTQPFVDALTSALMDSDERVRQRAIEVAAADPQIVSKLDPQVWTSLVADPSIHVQYQLAYDAALLFPDSSTRGDVLAKIVTRHPQDPLILWAVEGSLQDASGLFLQRLMDQGETALSNGSLLGATIFQVLRHDNGQASNTAEPLVERLMKENSPAALTVIAQSLEGLSPASVEDRTGSFKHSLADWILKAILPKIKSDLASGEYDPQLTVTRFQLVRWAAPNETIELLAQCLQPNQDSRTQMAALKTLAAYDAESVQIVLNQMDRLDPGTQKVAIEFLNSSSIGRTVLAKAVADGKMRLDGLPEAIRKNLSNDTTKPKADSAELAMKIEQYRHALGGPVDLQAGSLVFKEKCSSCHRIGGVGTQVGPDLNSLKDKSSEQILISIMDPNREIDPKYRVVQILTEFGRIISGIVVEESDSSLRLLDGQAQMINIQRDQVESIKTTEKSLMPERMFDDISTSKMASLIHYLQESLKGE